MRIHIFIFAVLCLLGSSSFADDIYKTVDENGKVVFSDAPKGAAEKMEVKAPNSVPPPAYMPHTPPPTKQQNTPSYTLHIQHPANATQVGPSQKVVMVEIALNPRLASQHRIQLFVNGKPVGAASQSTTLPLSGLRRGQQSIVASVVDANGHLLASSTPIVIHVIRPNPKATP